MDSIQFESKLDERKGTDLPVKTLSTVHTHTLDLAGVCPNDCNGTLVGMPLIGPIVAARVAQSTHHSYELC